MTKFAVFSYVKDRSRNETVPAGVVVWSSERGWHKIRFFAEDSFLAEDTAEAMPYIALVQEKLAHWEETGQLPYAEDTLRPCQDAWWLHVGKLLNHEIRLSPPRELPLPVRTLAVFLQSEELCKAVENLVESAA